MLALWRGGDSLIDRKTGGKTIYHQHLCQLPPPSRGRRSTKLSRDLHLRNNHQIQDRATVNKA